MPVVIPPGGITNADGEAGFFADENGGIDAVDLENGKTLWHSNDADKALIVHGKLLWAELGAGHTAKLIALDLGSGKKMLESEPIVLPDWAMVTAAKNGPAT